MHLNPDVHHQYALDRQQRLRDEAAAQARDRMPTRTRLAWFLRRATDRPDAATAAPGAVGTPLTQRSYLDPSHAKGAHDD